MTIKQDAKAKVDAFFNENADSDATITATQLSELVNRDAKTVRERLRKVAARNQSELKGARWRITKTIAVTELERVMRLEQASDSDEEQAS